MAAGLPELAVSRPLEERRQARADAAAPSPAGPRQGLARALTPKRGRCLGPGKKKNGDPDDSDLPNGSPGLVTLSTQLRVATEDAPEGRGHSGHKSDQIRTITGFGSHRIHQDISYAQTQEERYTRVKQLFGFNSE
jgi:hypothetical protein